MSNVYHGVPEQMVGNKLLPLSRLRETNPQLYDHNAQKYKGREEVMERSIPLLNCKWNDVIQFLPLHPRKVFELQKELHLVLEVPPYKFFEVDLALLDPSKTVVFFKAAPGDEHVAVKWLKDVDFASLQDIPRATVDYYKSLQGSGELPFNYQFIPHVLYKSELDVANVPKISLA